MGGLTPLNPKDWDEAKARHLLVRAGFGGTPQEVRKAVSAMGPYKAVDHLVQFHKLPAANAPLDIAQPLLTDPFEKKLRNQVHDCPGCGGEKVGGKRPGQQAAAMVAAAHGGVAPPAAREADSVLARALRRAEQRREQQLHDVQTEPDLPRTCRGQLRSAPCIRHRPRPGHDPLPGQQRKRQRRAEREPGPRNPRALLHGRGSRLHRGRHHPGGPGADGLHLR